MLITDMNLSVKAPAPVRVQVAAHLWVWVIQSLGCRMHNTSGKDLGDCLLWPLQLREERFLE